MRFQDELSLPGRVLVNLPIAQSLLWLPAASLVLIAYVARWYQCTLVLWYFWILLDTDLHNAHFLHTLEIPMRDAGLLLLQPALSAFGVNLGPGMYCVRYLHDHTISATPHTAAAGYRRPLAAPLRKRIPF